MKIGITYFSATGNTEAMAESIKNILDKENFEYYYSSIENINENDFFDCDKFIMGSHADGEEEIDTLYLEPFIIENEDKFEGKELFLFGSYSWGDGEFMDNWKNDMKKKNAIVVDTFIAQEYPDSLAIETLNEKILNFI